MAPTDDALSAVPSSGIADLPDGGARGVTLTDADGEAVAAVVVRRGDRLHAYRNRCPHNGVRLDFVPGDFLSDDGRHLRCGTHGALFRPDTGKCVRGPCRGKRLEPVTLAVDGG